MTEIATILACAAIAALMLCGMSAAFMRIPERETVPYSNLD